MIPRELLALNELKERLRTSHWDVLARPFIAGFSPLSARLPALTLFALEQEILFPPRMPRSTWTTWVMRAYMFRNTQAQAAIKLTVVVDRMSAAGAIDGLLLHLVQSQRQRSLAVDNVIGSNGIDIRETGFSARHFLRHNIGISVEDMGGAGEIVPRLANEVDRALSEQATEDDLASAYATPKIVGFRPVSEAIELGGETGLILEIKDEHPPVSVNFDAALGSVNVQTMPELRRYFRAGPQAGLAKVSVIAINSLNLSAVADCNVSVVRTSLRSNR